MRSSAQYEQQLEEGIKARLQSMSAATVDCVHLWQLDCCSVTCSDESCFAALTPSERARSARFSLDHDRRVFGIGRATLRALLGAYLERPPRDVVITHGKFGKPGIQPSANTHGLEFSIAHSGGRILFAVTRERAVGIDVERLRHVARLSSVARAIFTPEEWRAWGCIEDSQRLEALFRAWVRKEAVLKGLGCGLAVRPSRIGVTHVRGKPPAFILPVECTSRRPWRLRDLHRQRGWAAALALEGRAAAATIYTHLDSSVGG